MKRHALFIGVNNYADSTIQNLNYPSEDATELASVFRRLLKFNRVEKLINPKHAPEVVDAVKDMTRGLGTGDLFLFFFAGHGFRVKENHVLVCAKDEFADLEDEYAGLPVGQLKKRMRGPWNRMLILDACQNDIRATRGADTGATERDLALIHEAEGSSSESGYQIVLTACSEGQKALEVSDLGHGLFTSAFLDSVTAFADARRRIDLEALRTDLGGRMSHLITQYRLSGRQEPMFTMPADAGGIILLDGVAPTASMPQPPPSYHQPVDVFVLCSVCGFRNREEQTFRCQVCGRDYLCKAHFDKQERCCDDCAAKKRKEREAAEREAEAERKAREEVERKALEEASRRVREESLQNGTCLETGICRTIILPGGVKMEMIYCPPGEFMMGSPTTEEGRLNISETQHRVRLTKGFWLGKCPVTQKQWKSVMRNNPSVFMGKNLPVECVSWNDCQRFIAKVNASLNCGARLPTEAEWEYACRAGTTTAYFWGNALNGDNANCDGNRPCGTQTKGPYLKKTTPVGRYGANAWGFADMHGNVQEWCDDWFGLDYNGDAVDPTGPVLGKCRVMRGGDWHSNAMDCRSACRVGGTFPDHRHIGTGFRLCCSAGPRVGGVEQ